MDPRTPILIGVGTSVADAEALDLMGRAVDAAGADCGVPALLAQVERIAVTRGTWSYADPGRAIAARIGAAAKSVLIDVGIPQQTVIDETLTLLRDGSISVALVVGGEAKARAARLQQSSTKADAAGIASMVRGGGTAEAVATETDQGDVEPDERQSPTDSLVDPAELQAGLWAPVDQYALMEMALGAAEGRTPGELQHDVAALSAAQNLVAQANPEAAFPTPMGADALATFGPTHRPLAFPYGKWHITQWTVDQAAALLFTTVGAAERAGVSRDRWVFPLVGLSSSLTVPLTQRRDVHRWPAMAVLGAAAEAHLGAPLTTCEHVELYSCFPVAVRIQQRELGLDLDAPTTLTGGMSFAGGPFNSSVFQALPTLIRRLRDHGGRGLITSVSGFLTKPGLGVWSVDSPEQPLLLADLVDEARAATATMPVCLAHHGPATVVSATVTYAGMDPKDAIAILATPTGERVLARSEDPQFMTDVMTVGVVGRTVTVDGDCIVT